jgi:hypothetical protein
MFNSTELMMSIDRGLYELSTDSKPPLIIEDHPIIEDPPILEDPPGGVAP